MADIRQAAEWMKEGKTVCRRLIPQWKIHFTRGPHGLEFLAAVNSRHTSELNAEDLLADDWEIAE